MADQNQSAAEFRRLLLASASTLGRYQGPELFQSFTVDLNTPQNVVLPRQLNINRPLHSILIALSFRATVSVGAYADVSVEAPQESRVVKGHESIMHRPRGLSRCPSRLSRFRLAPF